MGGWEWFLSISCWREKIFEGIVVGGWVLVVMGMMVMMVMMGDGGDGGDGGYGGDGYGGCWW